MSEKNIIKVENEEHFEETIDQNEVVLVDVYADWCGPCNMMEPVLEKVADKVDAPIAKVDAEALEPIVKKYNAQALPSFLLFRKGEVIDRKIGVQNHDDLQDWINTAYY